MQCPWSDRRTHPAHGASSAEFLEILTENPERRAREPLGSLTGRADHRGSLRHRRLPAGRGRQGLAGPPLADPAAPARQLARRPLAALAFRHGGRGRGVAAARDHSRGTGRALRRMTEVGDAAGRSRGRWSRRGGHRCSAPLATPKIRAGKISSARPSGDRVNEQRRPAHRASSIEFLGVLTENPECQPVPDTDRPVVLGENTDVERVVGGSPGNSAAATEPSRRRTAPSLLRWPRAWRPTCPVARRRTLTRPRRVSGCLSHGELQPARRPPGFVPEANGPCAAM